MKNVKQLWVILLILLALESSSQEAIFQTDTRAKIEPLNLAISMQKTTNLIFPFAIKSVDRGSADVLVQKAKSVENVLQLKAARDSFEETNLSVIAGDGLLYSFILHFAKEPSVLNLELINKPMGYQPIAIFSEQQDNQQKIMNTSEVVSAKDKTMKRPKDRASGMHIRLSGMYIKDNVLFYQLSMQNKSNIRYDFGQLRFYIRDKKKSTRTASQELEQVPLHLHGNATVLYQKSSQVIVVALEKFTIPDKKELVIQLMEGKGGRNLMLKVSNRKLMKAIPLS